MLKVQSIQKRENFKSNRKDQKKICSKKKVKYKKIKSIWMSKKSKQNLGSKDEEWVKNRILFTWADEEVFGRKIEDWEENITQIEEIELIGRINLFYDIEMTSLSGFGLEYLRLELVFKNLVHCFQII